MRVFETCDICDDMWTVAFSSDAETSRCIRRRDGVAGAAWTLPEVLVSDRVKWREIPFTPTDITKLDCVGVFHVEPVKVERTPGHVCRDGYWNGPRKEGLSVYESSWEAAAQAVLADANATIAELRREWYVQETNGLNAQVAGQRRNIEKLQAERDDLRRRVAELEKQVVLYQDLAARSLPHVEKLHELIVFGQPTRTITKESDGAT